MEQTLVIGFAAASIWRLAIADRITQWLRYKFYRRLAKAGGWIPYHLQYLVGCALCFPLWCSIALYLTINGIPHGRVEYAIAVAVIFAARIVGYSLLKWLNETQQRDLPEGVSFPPR